MTWREKTVARILVLLARLVCDDAELSSDLKHLHNHFNAGPQVEEKDR